MKGFAGCPNPENPKILQILIQTKKIQIPKKTKKYHFWGMILPVIMTYICPVKEYKKNEIVFFLF